VDRRPARSFQEAAAKAGLRRVRLHDRPHGLATAALARGVHPKVVQERLGHATIGITLGFYSHTTQSLHSDAAETVAAALFGEVAEGCVSSL
jgi:integrase